MSIPLCGLHPLLGVDDQHRVAYRIQVHGELLYSAQYGRVQKRNSFTVRYKYVNNILQYETVQYYIVSSSETVLAVIKNFTSSTTCQMEFDLSTDVLNDVTGAARPVAMEPDSQIVITSAECIQEKCLLVDVGFRNKYIVCFPNRVHLD